MSSASVRFFLFLTHMPEQSKLTNPHYAMPSEIAGGTRTFGPYLVEVYADGVCALVDRGHATMFPILRTGKRHTQPSSIYVKPYIWIAAH